MAPVRWSSVMTLHRLHGEARRSDDGPGFDARPPILGPGRRAIDQQVRPKPLGANGNGKPAIEVGDGGGIGDQERKPVGKADHVARPGKVGRDRTGRRVGHVRKGAGRAKHPAQPGGSGGAASARGHARTPNIDRHGNIRRACLHAAIPGRLEAEGIALIPSVDPRHGGNVALGKDLPTRPGHRPAPVPLEAAALDDRLVEGEAAKALDGIEGEGSDVHGGIDWGGRAAAHGFLGVAPPFCRAMMPHG